MQSIFEIVAGPSATRLTTLQRVKSELKITTSENDAILNQKIDEASSDVTAAVGKALASADVRETYWHDRHMGFAGPTFGYAGHGGDVLFLRRTPISTLASVTLDDDVVDPSEYRLDADAGLLYRLDSSGYPINWWFSKAIVVLYTGGFILPGVNGRNLEAAIEGATVALVCSYWLSRGRDPMVKTEDVQGIGRREYWVGAVGDPELLPPRVLSSLSAFRRPAAA